MIYHLSDLREVLERRKKYGLKMNPHKCGLGLSGGGGSILGVFLVHERGIEVSHRSIESIKKMEPLAKKNRAPVIDRQDQLH
jgi:tRNA(Ile)-lysidine synthase TilS/MesJ